MTINPIIRQRPGSSAGHAIPAISALNGGSVSYNAGGRRDYSRWVILNEFRSTYYSGLDISVYAGGVYIDEVVNLQYTEMEQVRPLFGYNDYTFRQVCHGSRIVQGSFAINFKDAGYIPQLLQRIKDPASVNNAVRAITQLQADNAKVSDTEDLQYLEEEFRSYSPQQLALSRDLSLEDIVNIDASRMAYNQGGYARLMDELKTKYWGGTTITEDATVTVTPKESDRAPKYQSTIDTDALGFDLVVKYGQPEDYQGGNRPGWGTLEVIKDCHISSMSKAIDDTGRNTLEIYQFIARTIE